MSYLAGGLAAPVGAPAPSLYDQLSAQGRRDAIDAARQGGGGDTVVNIEMRLNGEVGRRSRAVNDALADFPTLITWRKDFADWMAAIDHKQTGILRQGRDILVDLEQYPHEFYNTPGGKAGAIKRLRDNLNSLSIKQTETRKRVETARFEAEARDRRAAAIRGRLASIEQQWSALVRRRDPSSRHILVPRARFDAHIGELDRLQQEAKALFKAEDEARLQYLPNDGCRLCSR